MGDGTSPPPTTAGAEKTTNGDDIYEKRLLAGLNCGKSGSSDAALLV